MGEPRRRQSFRMPMLRDLSHDVQYCILHEMALGKIWETRFLGKRRQLVSVIRHLRNVQITFNAKTAVATCVTRITAR